MTEAPEALGRIVANANMGVLVGDVFELQQTIKYLAARVKELEAERSAWNVDSLTARATRAEEELAALKRDKTDRPGSTLFTVEDVHTLLLGAHNSTQRGEFSNFLAAFEEYRNV